MFHPRRLGFSLLLPVLCLATAHAAAADTDKAPDSIAVYFSSGSVHVSGAEAAKLDQAAHLYREGKPLLMTVSGGR